MNKNSRDFDEPSIRARLARHACKLLGNFESGYHYIQSKRQRAL